LPPFLTQDKFGEILLAGHRIPLYTIVRLTKAGRSVAELVAELPTLSRVQVEQVLAFCQANQADVEAYAAGIELALARQAAAPAGPGLLKIRHLQAQLQQAEQEHAGDPNWVRLSIQDKLHRAGLLDTAGA
jgi:uncharacterized protein (DUF433 family)